MLISHRHRVFQREEKYNELPQVEQFIKANSGKFGSTEHYTRLCGKESLLKLPGIVNSLEEPVSLGTIIPTDQVCELASNKLKVVLTGEGADEIFAGYRKFSVEAAASQYKGLATQRQRELLEIYPELEFYMAVRHNDPAKRYIQSEALFNAEELKMLLGSDDINTQFPKDALPVLSGKEHPLNGAIAFEARSRLPDYVILRLDKLSMRHSLETRTPFLDYRLAEFAARLPVNFKVDLNNDLEKYICRYAFSKYSILDEVSSFRKKQPFTIPSADWLSEPKLAPEFLQDILLGDVVKGQGILNQDFIRKFTKMISPKGIGPQTLVSEADRVFAIIIFTIWHNQFMEN